MKPSEMIDLEKVLEKVLERDRRMIDPKLETMTAATIRTHQRRPPLTWIQPLTTPHVPWSRHLRLKVAAHKLSQAADLLLKTEVAPYKALNRAQQNRRIRLREAVMEVEGLLDA